MASSSSLLSPPLSLTRNWKHHVFPSFHGADVRKAFLSHVLKELRSKGIEPFIDSDIERSKSIRPELVEAIRGSRIAIVLLSKNYASSTSCLDELVEIINCRKEFGQTVMTLFYEVDPTDVKKQKGDFGNAFRTTCEGRTESDMGIWKQALEEVSQIAGYHSRIWDTEAEMIEIIATDVLNKLNNSTASSDFEGLVGMKSHMINIGPLLQLDLEEVRMIGIFGPSGIGKTTIARYIFDQHSENFHMSVFMENIKRRYPIPACSDDYSVKLFLQEQFMSQIINNKGFRIPHLGVIKDRLKDKKVLVVLDDVDRLVQLEAMAKETCWFGPWSRIIITTQDRKVLQAGGVNHTYKVDFPSNDEALQMFCMNAFGQKSPKDGFGGLAWEVTRITGKLPLALRVMGSYFRGMSKQEWITTLPVLTNRLNSEIESILKFSYDTLCGEDKKLFLHIACFFNNERVNIVEGCLAKSFRSVSLGLRVLVEKSLISIDLGNIKMHNLLVQLGREIVRNQSVNEPGKRQFLDDAIDIAEVLSDDKADNSSVIGLDLLFPYDDMACSSESDTSEVLSDDETDRSGDTGERAFCYKDKYDLICTSERVFENLSNLQFLRIFGRDTNWYFPRSLDSISRKLRLLSWEGFPMPCFPSSFSSIFLVKLDMQHSDLEKLWEETKPLSNLKWMDLSSSKSLKELPDLSSATNLEHLVLSYCPSLVELPFSIGNAVNLRKLKLNDCSSLVELPSSIGNAINLQILNLSCCSSLVKLPYSIGNAINLQELDISYCSGLEKLPSSIGNATNIQKFNLSKCSRLVELPSSITNIIRLKSFSLDGCLRLAELPFNIETVIDPKHLDLNHCSSLVKLPSSIGNAINLQKLNLSYCSSLVKLPSSIENTINLQKLNLGFCSSLVELPSSIGNVINLQELHLNHCSSLVNLPFSIGDAVNLQTLNLGWCQNLVELPSSIWNAISLQTLDLSNCASLLELPSFITIADSLQTLKLSHCSSLVELPSSIGNAFNLQTLDLSNCSSLVELSSSIGNAINLQTLNLAHCTSLVKLPSSIGNAINLQKLDLGGCLNLVELPLSIGNATNLQKVNLSYCSSLMELPSTIGNAKSLQSLNLSHCSSLLEFPSSMKNLGKLSNLDLENCSKLEVVLTNINLESLEELDLSDCSLLKNYPKTSTNIKHFKPSGTAIKEMPSLMSLWPLDPKFEMQELGPWIGRVSCLRRLVLSGMHKLVSLPQLPYSLLRLDAQNCESLERLDCSFLNPGILLNFAECFKLNQKARDLIIQTPTNELGVFPCGELPACFTYRAYGSFLAVKLHQMPLGTSTKFRACVILADKYKYKFRVDADTYVSCHIMSKQNVLIGCKSDITLPKPVLPEHLYTFEIEVVEMTSTELVFQFQVGSDWISNKTLVIKECGILHDTSCGAHMKRKKSSKESKDDGGTITKRIKKE